VARAKTVPEPAPPVDREVELIPRLDVRRPVPTDYIERNRKAWEAWSAAAAFRSRQEWLAEELEWGLWNTPESALRLLDWMEPGSHVIELGCGTAGVSSWLARSGMHPVAVDFSRKQIDRAAEFQREFEVFFDLVHANAEEVPFDRESFDVAVSEYGASVWCDPMRWLPEARRLLRNDGRLIFFTPAPMMLACTPTNGGLPGRHLTGEYFSLRFMQFDQDSGIEFQLTYSGWARLLYDTGFVIEDIVETRPDPRAKPRHPLVENEWARRWPTEIIWVARAVRELPAEEEIGTIS
jgi:SAM-dependent methyltransferase